MFDIPNFAAGEIVGGGDVRAVSYGADQGLYVEFRNEDIHQPYESEKQGRPIYKQEVFVRIYTPGDKTKVVDRKARLEPQGDIPSDPQRWPRQWQAFQNGEQAVYEGTPLKEWPKVNVSQIRDLSGMNIHTVEQLAAVSDHALSGLGHGGRALRDSAKLWLDDASKSANSSAAMKERDDKIAALEAQIIAMQNAQANSDKRGPGRPRKDDAE